MYRYLLLTSEGSRQLIKMAAASGRVDEFVKDYLLHRGLSATLRTFDVELRNEKEKSFRVSYPLTAVVSIQ